MQNGCLMNLRRVKTLSSVLPTEVFILLLLIPQGPYFMLTAQERYDQTMEMHLLFAISLVHFLLS